MLTIAVWYKLGWGVRIIWNGGENYFIFWPLDQVDYALGINLSQP
jgi:hypothetical protein